MNEKTMNARVTRVALRETVIEMGGRPHGGDLFAVLFLAVLAVLLPPYALAGLIGYGLTRLVLVAAARLMQRKK